MARDRRARWVSLSAGTPPDWVWESHPDIIAVNPDDFDLDGASRFVEEIARAQATPVTVEGDRLRVNEERMLYDTLYPVTVQGANYEVVLRSDGALEVYEVAG